ncbi:MAG TPA: anti-sigma factor [Lacunisphaera sp.]|nr:anti-sigma factor [Lacunisphaera sp.]
MNDLTEDLAALYVLDQLDPRERAAFEARLSREPALATLVRDLETGFAAGVRSLPPVEPSAELFARIEARLDEHVPAAPAARVRAATPPTWTFFARWGLAAVVAVSLATLAVQSLRPSAARPVFVFVGLDNGSNTFADLPLAGTAKDPDARFMHLASLAESFWAKPGEQPGRADPTVAGNHGYALFDPASRQGFIAIERLPVLAKTQRYHLWIVDPETTRIHDAGSLPLSGLNRGLYSFSLEPGAALSSNRPGFFITIEEKNSPAAAKPQGEVVLGHHRI